MTGTEEKKSEHSLLTCFQIKEQQTKNTNISKISLDDNNKSEQCKETHRAGRSIANDFAQDKPMPDWCCVYLICFVKSSMRMETHIMRRSR